MARKSVNDAIHDDLITEDIQLRRITGDCQNRAERRLDKLASDLRAELARIDPHGTDRKDARERRLAKLEKRARELTAEAYRDIERENRSDLRRIARLESEATVTAIGNNLP